MVFAFILAVFLSGCQSAPPSPMAQEAEAPALSSLQAGDQISITVLGDEDLSGAYELDPRGFITMPLVGQVQAAGLSPQDLQAEISTRLSEGYIVDPKVSVELASLRPFYILGEVKNPGSYPALADLDVFKAIATAGGLTPRASSGSYIIYRGVGAQRREIPARDETPVFPGDSIRVKERFF